MIKATELRIGNFWMPEWSKEIRRADWMDIRDIADGKLLSKPLGILLTEDWLFKMGFKKIDIDGTPLYRLEYEDDDNSVRIDFDFELFDCLTINGDFSIHNVFRYVHQIQNLYFVLLQKELI